MKHIPLINRGTSSSTAFGRQLLVDEDDYYEENDVVNITSGDNQMPAVEEFDGEGTECVIDTQIPHKHYVDTATRDFINRSNAPYSDDDAEYHPPMCGQLFISKVIGQNGGSGNSRKQQPKTKELRSQRRTYNRRSPLLRLSKSERTKHLTKKRSTMMGGGGGYHESFSAEQSPDSDSESSSVQSFNDRIRILSETTTTTPTSSTTPSAVDNHQNASSNRSCGGDSDTTSSLPSHIVQFDPNELELIKTEKIWLDENADNNPKAVPVNNSHASGNDNLQNDTANNAAKSLTTNTATSPSNATIVKPNKGGKGEKRSKVITAALSSFPFSSPSTRLHSTMLPTVAEEKSFDLVESPSTASVTSNKQISKDIKISKIQEATNLLPTASSTSSSGDDDEDESAFFGCHTNQHGNRGIHVNSTDDVDDEMRDDREATTPLSQFGCFTPTSNHNEAAFFSSESETSPDYNESKDRQRQPKERSLKPSENNDEKNTQKDSPEMMEILNAMRQIIFKQQDAIQAISDENIEFRNQLAICHREMKSMQTESADQLIQITQLVIQKKSLDAETTQLKDEVAVLRDEILRLKSDDADLVNRFESLMNNNDDMTDDDTTVDNIETICKDLYGHSSAQQQRDSPNVTPLDSNNGQVSVNELWRQMLEPYDKTNASKRVTVNNNEQTKCDSNNDSSVTYSKPSITDETIDSSIVDVNTSLSSNSASITVETILSAPETANDTKNSTLTTKNKLAPEHLASKDKDVAEFKNRLGEIQKKRMMRTGPGSSNNRNSSAAANTKDRKVLTVRFL